MAGQGGFFARGSVLYIIQTTCQPEGTLRAELGLEKLAQSLGDSCRVVRSGKEVLAAGQALVDVGGKWFTR